MPRRKAWSGAAPGSPEEARRSLLDAARRVVERVGLSKAALSDVAEEAGVTRQTVYRYFANTEDLFLSAAALASGGFHERMRARVMTLPNLPTLAERMVECLVFSIREIPKDPHLATLVSSGDSFTLAEALSLSFVQEEIVALADGNLPMSETSCEEIAELLLRTLLSFTVDPGKSRSETELRRFLLSVLVPTIEAHTKSRV
ncbi:MAG: AcrR family transcriptional regulator [Hyphomicrobiaceae bacterium]|jgi:AcrR family transcriptional regulator